MPTKILLIEHNPDHILLTKRILQKSNDDYQIDTAEEADSGEKRCVEEDYDLVLSDYRLPGSSAMDILRGVREKGKDTPFVVVTAAGNEKIAVELMKEGASDYVVKDAAYEDILPIVVEQSIERYRIKKAKDRAEEALRESELRYRLLAENVTDVIWTADLNLKWTYLSPSIIQVFGYSAEESVGLTLEDMLVPASRILAKKTFLAELAEARKNTGDLKRSVVLELEFQRKDGATTWAEVKTTFLRDDNNDPIGLIGVTRDITQRKKAQDELVNAYQMTRDILEKSPFGIAVVNGNGIVEYVNPKMIEISGDLKEHFENLNMINLETYKDRGIDQKIKEALQGQGFFMGAVDYTSHYGKKHTIRNFTGIPLKDMEERKMLMFVEDITELKTAEQKLAEAYKKLKETQEQLIQSSKMVAMGQLAAGISHELNQPLTGVKGFAQAALMDLDAGHPVRSDLQRIVEQADRMDMIIKNVRFFARKSDFTMEELDVNKPIEDSLGLLNEQLRVHNIKVKTSLKENLPKIQGDCNQLQQVFLNLITNARDAIDILNNPEGGELEIVSGVINNGKEIEITFEDTGGGIPNEHKDQVFNPFYTTKSPDGGMGLGLSIAYRIIENHKGKIEVVSSTSSGTKFRIILPVEKH
ncbi:MAG: PAS domain S-box protein [Candidatus Omnitrophota bacterium]